jgi:hypothetical protein
MTRRKGKRKPPGRKAYPIELRRTERVVLRFTKGQDADITFIGDAWDVPPAVALYGVIATWLSKARRTAPSKDGPAGIALEAAIAYVRASGYTVTE